MDTSTYKNNNLTNFRIKSTLGVAVITLIFLTPFAINHFIQGRFMLGAGSMAIVILCAVNAWSCIQRRYYPLLIFWGLVPATIIFVILAFREQGAVITYWCYPALLSFYFMLPKRLAWIANSVFLIIILPQAWLLIEPSIMLRFVVTILSVSAFSAMFLQVISGQQKELEEQVVTDPLTGLLNRILLNDVLEQTVQQFIRTGTPMTLLALDIDHFKAINDSLGHAGGDEVLRGVADFFKTRARGSDKVFRIGGEEFLILLYNTHPEPGMKVAKVLCDGIASLPLLPDREVTVSTGVATLKNGESWEDWMKRCDEKLYQAKHDGRNRVVA